MLLATKPALEHAGGHGREGVEGNGGAEGGGVRRGRKSGSRSTAANSRLVVRGRKELLPKSLIRLSSSSTRAARDW